MLVEKEDLSKRDQWLNSMYPLSDSREVFENVCGKLTALSSDLSAVEAML